MVSLHVPTDEMDNMHGRLRLARAASWCAKEMGRTIWCKFLCFFNHIIWWMVSRLGAITPSWFSSARVSLLTIAIPTGY